MATAEKPPSGSGTPAQPPGPKVPAGSGGRRKPRRTNPVVQQIQAGAAEVVDRVNRGPLGELDAMSLIPALFRASLSISNQPTEVARVAVDYFTGTLTSGWAAAARAFGVPAVGQELAKDKRFADRAWTDNPAFFWLREQFALVERAADELVDVADLTPQERSKTKFVAHAILDACAPTNFAATNPAVLKRALETGGQSLSRGVQNFMTDLVNNEGQPRQVATGVHEVGRNLAVTPGKVVFRNDLMELIQYSPTTDLVHEIPVLFSPPWINKYYVMDLAPGRSLVEWAVQHGHTVFLISYRNPDETMRNVRMDDYLLSGPRVALDVITEITGSEKVNLLGLCLGGTLTMATLAYLDATGDERINCATFLNTMLDFEEPGMLGVTTDESTVAKLEKTMNKTGFLSADSMAKTFDLLRANDLIWNYVVSNWLLGEDPPAFDILTWNADSTRMPATMHSFYLRNCYLQNRLVKGEMELAGQQLDVRRVDQDLYFLAAEQDHIAPWRSSYAGARLPTGHVRFVLSNAGHIAGIVNPPNPKSKHWVGATDELPPSADEWLETATMHPTTWWEDWAVWIGERAGAMRKPPPIGSTTHPPLGDAPGSYVFGS